jgi:hypothetical protein
LEVLSLPSGIASATDIEVQFFNPKFYRGVLQDSFLRVAPHQPMVKAPFSLIQISGQGWNTTNPVYARFFGPDGFSINVPAVGIASNRLDIPVPMNGWNPDRTVSRRWQLSQPDPNQLISSSITNIQIESLPIPKSPPGALSLSLLKASLDAATNYLVTLTNSPWNTFEVKNSLSNQIVLLTPVVSQLEAVILNRSTGFLLGTIGDKSIWINSDALMETDRLLLGFLQSVANQDHAVPPFGEIAKGSMLNSEAKCGGVAAGNLATAATQGDPQLEKWAREFVYAPRQSATCHVPNSFNLSYQVVGGSGAVAIGLLALVGVPASALALPAAALLYVTIEGAGGMIALGGALGQTTDEGRRLVRDGIAKIEELKWGALKAAVPPLGGAMAAIALGGHSFKQAFASAPLQTLPFCSECFPLYEAQSAACDSIPNLLDQLKCVNQSLDDYFDCLDHCK